MPGPTTPRVSNEERIPPLLALAAQYESVRELGRGGTAVVYLARVRETGEEVAIKLIHARYAEDAEAVARFSREARFIAQLDHPNVVRVHTVLDLGDGGVALVMAHVPGRTLKQLILEGGPLAPDRAERIMREMASALGAAHARGIVHRDVKPENIFIDDEGRALLADFGVARSMSNETQQLTMHGVAIGTPTYMAPEQIDGGELDGRGDIYSLGLVAWEMLSGRRPWDGEALYSVLYNQKHGHLPAVHELRSDVPPHFVEAIEGAIEKDREARWQTTDELIAALAGNPPVRRAPAVVALGTDTVRFVRQPERPLDAPATEVAAAFAFTPELVEAANAPVSGNRRHLVAGALVSLVALILLVGAVQAWSGDAERRRQVAQGTDLSQPTLVQTPGGTARGVSHGDVLGAAAGDSAVPGSSAPVENTGAGDLVATDVATTVATPGSAAAGASAAGTDLPLGIAMGRTAGEAARRSVPPPTPPARSTAQATASAISLPAARSVATVPTPPPPMTTAATPDATPTSTRAAPTVAGTRARLVTGGRHTCLLSGDGRGYCWGSNDRGQLGIGSVGRASTPTLIAAAQRFTSVAPGLSHSCALDAEGRAWCWGENSRGQLGDRTTTSRDTPTRVVGEHEFRSIVAGASHSCGLDENGVAWCWGSGDAGQLGDGESQERSAPVAVKASRRFVSLHAGWNFTCALDAGRRATCWGDDGAGQLGDGGATNRRTPASVQGRLSFAALSAGNTHACGVTTGGDTYCWGGNAGGQLGDGSATDRPVPVRVASETPFITVTTGAVHSCALTAEGEAYCWGRNTYGQLGDGGTQDRSAPVRVAGGHTFSSIRAFGSHTCGATPSGEAFCWGYNVDGQLGDGTRVHRTRPVYVERPAGR